MKKRLIAFVLFVSMMVSSLGDVSGVVFASAEETEIPEETQVVSEEESEEEVPAQTPAEEPEVPVPAETIPVPPADTADQAESTAPEGQPGTSVPDEVSAPAVQEAPVPAEDGVTAPAQEVPVPAEGSSPAAPAQDAPAQSESSAPAAPAQEVPAQSESSAPAAQVQEAPAQAEGSVTVSAPAQEASAQGDSSAPAAPAQDAPAQGESSAPAATEQEAPAQNETNSQPAAQNETNAPAPAQNETGEPATQQGESSEPSSDFLYPITSEDERNGEENNQEELNQEENSEPAAQQGESSEPASDFLYPVTSDEGNNGEENNQEELNQEENSEPAAPQGESSEPASDFLYQVTSDEGNNGEENNQEELNQEENSEPADAEAQQGAEVQEELNQEENSEPVVAETQQGAEVQETDKQTEDNQTEDSQTEDNQTEENSTSAAPAAEAKASRTIQTQVGDRIITVTGNFPEGTEIQAVEIPQDTAKKMTGRQSDYAYDVRLMVNGEVWQPEDYGEEVKVTIQNLDGTIPEQKSEIIHVKADLMDEEGKLSQEAIETVMHETMSRMVETETLEAETEDGKSLSFDTSSFSPMVNAPSATPNLLQKMFENAITQRTEGELKEKIQIILEKNTTYGNADDIAVFELKDGYTAGEGFAVEVIAEDAGDDGLQADGSTVYLGSLTILGVPVVIKGVTMPGNVLVNGTGSSLDYSGTRADDGLNLTVEMGAQATVRTGEGADTVNANVEDQDSSLTVDTGAGADIVTAKVSNVGYGAGTAKIETGEGEDTVTVDVTGEGSRATIDTGADADTVTATATNAKVTDGFALSVLTGDDRDVIRTKLSGFSAANIDSGEGDDTVDAVVEDNSNAAIRTGTGDDAIGVTVAATSNRPESASEDPFVTVDAGAGDDTVLVAGKTSTSMMVGADNDKRGIVRINLGDGADELGIDLSVAYAAKKVDVAGGDGHDHLHFTGSLRPIDNDHPENATGEVDETTGEARLTFQTGHYLPLDVIAKDVTSLTDDLENKETIEIRDMPMDLVRNLIGTVTVRKSFANYIIYQNVLNTAVEAYLNAKGYDIDNVDLPNTLTIEKAEDAGNLLLTNVLLKPAVDDTSRKLNIRKNTTITAKDLQLVLSGKNVTVNGTLKAGNVRIEATDGTDRDAQINLTGRIPFTDIDLIPESLQGIYSLELLNLSDVAKVNIGEDAEIYSEGDIQIQANTDTNGGILNVGDLSNVNLIDLKVAKAEVNVKGKLYAGYDLDTKQEKEGSRGSVNIGASTKLTTGFDEDGKPVNGSSISVALANMDSLINIAESAEIYATDSIRLNAKADLRSAVRADTNGDNPVGIAAIYATVDAKTTVNGKLDAKNDVNVSASGNTEVTAVADNGKTLDGFLKGYAALSIVMQNVKAELGSTARVTAGRDVNVKSTAREKVDTTATTDSVDGKSDDPTALQKTYDAATNYYHAAYDALTRAWLTVKGFFTGNNEVEDYEERVAAQEKLDKAINKVSVSDHSVQVDEYARNGGDVSINTDKTGATGKTEVTVTPKAGYWIKSITWRGLDAGETDYAYETVTYDDPDDSVRTASFTQYKANSTIFVEYEKDPDYVDPADDEDADDGEQTDEEAREAIFADGGSGIKNFNVTELVGRVTDGVTDSYGVAEQPQIDPANRTIELTLPTVTDDENNVLGTVLTYETETVTTQTVNTESTDEVVKTAGERKSLTKVAPGETLRLVVNPAANKILVSGSLKVKITKGAKTETIVVVQDDHGRYLVTIPEDATAVEVEAEFAADPQINILEGYRGNQIAGAVAITVSENNNQAVISETADGEEYGTEAGRDVNVTANSVADIRNTADGTSVTQQSVIPATTQQDEQANAGLGEKIIALPGETQIGEAKIPVAVKGDATKAALGEVVTVNVTQKNDKYHIQAGTLKAVLTSQDGSYSEEIFLNRVSDYTYTFRVPTLLPDGLQAADLSISLKGETADGATGAGVETTVGAALGLTVSSSHNKADIKGTVKAGEDINMQAEGEGAVRTDTRAGYSEGTTGIGGAISIQFGNVDSRARIHEKAAVALDGELSLEADNDAEFQVHADGTGSKHAASEMGVGAGIAVAVDNANASAALQDGATLTAKTDGAPINGLTLNANQRVNDSVTAAAGASSTGTSLMAAVVFDSATTSAMASLGNITGDALNVKDHVVITADNAAVHDVSTQGSVAGKGTGAGATIGITMVKDRAEATIGESLAVTGSGAGGSSLVEAAATNESALRSVNIGTASGGRIPFGLTVQDDMLMKLFNGAIWLAYLEEEKLPHAAVEVKDFWLKYHPPTLMNESSIGFTGAAGYNVQKSDAYAKILDGVEIKAPNSKIAVLSKNRTESVVKGDASTTDSTYGIGIAADLNTVKMNNVAFVGNGKITAASLEVSATTKEKELSFDAVETPEDIKDEEAEQWLTETIGESVGDYVNDMIREIGLLDLLPETVKDRVVDPAIDDMTQEILELSGLSEMFEEGFFQKVGDLIQDNTTILKWTGIGVLALALESDLLNVDKLLGATEAQKVVDDFKSKFNHMLIVSIRDAVVNCVAKNVVNIFTKSGGSSPMDIVNDVKDDIVGFINRNLKDKLKELDKAFMKDLSDAIEAHLTEEQIDSLIAAMDTGKKVYAAAQNVADAAECMKGYLDSVGEKIEQLLSYDEIVENYGDELVLDSLDAFEQQYNVGNYLETGFETLEDEGKDDLQKTLAESILASAEKNNVMLTDDQIAIIRNPYDLMVESDRASAGEHLIDTQSISGAGSFEKSIAGSGAVTNLDFTTMAQVGYDKLTVPDEPDPEKYTVEMTDYTDKVKNPSGLSFNDQLLKFPAFKKSASTLMKQFADRQIELDKQYQKDRAAYKQDKKNNKKPKEEDYKLSFDEFKATVGQATNADTLSARKWYNNYVEKLYGAVNDYIKAYHEKENEYNAAQKRHDDAIATNKAQLGDQIVVSGDFVVNADSNRFVNNVASASLNGKGSASANNSAADSANSDVGDSNAAQHVTQGTLVKLTTDVGATSEIAENDLSLARPKIWITLNPGFELVKEDGKVYANYSFNQDSDGKAEGSDDSTEVTGKVLLHESNGKYYIDPKDVKDAGDDTELFFTLGTQEVLRALTFAKPTLGEGLQNVGADTLSAEVKGRGMNEDQTAIMARAGDTVVVTIQKADGRRLDGLGYVYTDLNGDQHTVEINPATVTDKDLNSYAFASVTENSGEYIISFRMPEANKNGVTITSKFIDYDEDPSWMPNHTVKVNLLSQGVSGLGRGMGVGASVSMLKGSDDTIATIGLRQKGTNGEEDADGVTGVTAGSLSVTATSPHREEVSSVAGTDPFSGESEVDDISHMALDASVAKDTLDTSVRASLDHLNKAKINGYGQGAAKNDGDVIFAATENSETSISASAFSMGRGTAVGASVALNAANYAADVWTGEIIAKGDVNLAADSYSKDRTIAVASAVGADVIRVMRATGVDLSEKDAAEGGASEGNGYAEQGRVNKDTKETNERLNQNKDKNKEKDASDEGEDASENLPLSSNILRSQGVTTDIPEKEKDDIDEDKGKLKTIASYGLLAASGLQELDNFFCASKFQLAASVGSTHASHTANVTTSRAVKAGEDVTITSDNDANFAVVGTSAAMSILLKATSIAGGAALVDNKNEANVNINDDVIAGANGTDGNGNPDGDLTITSTLVQNMDEEYVNSLAAQSVAGSVAGYDSTAAIGAAVSKIKSNASTTVNIKDGEEEDRRVIQGRNIDIEAVDQSRLSARAGGVSVSLGSSIGVGVGVSMIKSANDVSAKIGKNTDITGGSLTLNAEKREVTEEDYQNLLEMKKAKDGGNSLVSYTEKENSDDGYNANVNLYASRILKLYDGINKYSFQNNYAEGIGASAELTRGTISMGGGSGVVMTENTIEALIGSGVKMNLAKYDEADGHLNVTAKDNATNRIIAGGLSIAPSSASVGASVGLLLNEDTATARIGSKQEDDSLLGDATVNAGGDITLSSEVGGTTRIFTAGMSMAISVPKAKKDKKGKPVTDKDGNQMYEGGSNAISGAVNYIVNKAIATTETGTNTKLVSGGNTTLESKADMDMMALAANSSNAAGFEGKAAGASVNIISDTTEANTTVGNGNTISGKEVKISSDASNQLITGVASQAAQATGDGSAIAAAVNVNYSGASAVTTVGGDSRSTITATEGDADITAHSDAWALTAAASLPGGVGTALGGSVNFNFFDRTANTILHSTAVKAQNGNIRIQSGGKDTSYMVGILLEGSVTGSAIGGNVTYMSEDNDIRVAMNGASSAAAHGHALIETAFNDKTLAAVGSIALANAAPAIGVTAIYINKTNNVITDLGDTTVTVDSKGSVEKNLIGEAVNGIYVGANATESQKAGAAGIALSGGLNLTAQTVVLVNENTVSADASGATLTANMSDWRYDRVQIIYGKSGNTLTDTCSKSKFENMVNKLQSGELEWLDYVLDDVRYRVDPEKVHETTYRLRSDEWKYDRVHVTYSLLGKTINSRVTMQDVAGMFDELVSGKRKIIHMVLDEGELDVDKSNIEFAYQMLKKNANITVAAKDDTEQTILAGGLNFSLTAGIGAAATTIVSSKTVEAKMHNVNAGGDVTLTADNNDDIHQIAVSTGVSASSAEINAGAAIQVLNSTVNAVVGKEKATEGSTVSSRTGNFTQRANNKTELNNIAATLAVGSNAVTPVGVVSQFTGETNAIVHEGSAVVAEGHINVKADAEKDIHQYTLGAAGSLGLGISGAVNLQIIKDSVTAQAEKNTILDANLSGLNIEAAGNYKLRAMSAALGIGDFGAAVNAVVSVLKSNTMAELAGTANAKSGTVNVKAYSSRDIINTADTLGGGSVGVGVTVMVLAAGAPMSQDAADMIAYGNMTQEEKDAKDKNGKDLNQSTFDARKFMEDVNARVNRNDGSAKGENANAQQTHASDYYTNALTGEILANDIRGNGHYESKEQVGTRDKKTGTGTFDSTSKLRSKDFDTQVYDEEKEKLDKQTKAAEEEKSEEEKPEEEKTAEDKSLELEKKAKTNANNTELGRGENLQTEKVTMYDAEGKVTTDESKADESRTVIEDISDTEDIAKAKKVNTYTYADPVDDEVIARIAESAVVNAEKVSVEAIQPVAADLLGITAGAGMVGIGVSTAVAIMHSNVFAASTGTINNATKGVNVKASSVSGVFSKDEAFDRLNQSDADSRDASVAGYMNNNLSAGEYSLESTDTAQAKAEKEEKSKQSNLSKLTEIAKNRSIRVMGIAVGFGEVGLAASAAVARTDNITEATLGGRITGAGDLNVYADHDYGDVLAATGSLSGGAVAVGVNVAVAQTNGRVSAMIGKNTTEYTTGEKAFDIYTTGNVNVTSHSDVKADALAVTAGAGAVAVNAGVALALNRLDQETGIDPGVKLNTTKDVNISAKSNTESNTWLLGLSMGFAAVNLNAAVSDVAADINTHIGESSELKDGIWVDKMNPVAKVKAKNVTIRNTVTSSSTPAALSVASGYGSATGNVLLAFNQTDARAIVDNADINATKLIVAGNLSGSAVSKLTAAQVGVVAVGLSVNYADMRASNQAVIMNSTVQTTGSTRIATNENNEKTTAEATTVSANMGGVTIGINGAIARNKTKNYATLIGDKKLDLGSLTMDSRGDSTAHAELDAITLSLGKIAAAAVIALNDADIRTTLLVGDSKTYVTTNEKGEEETHVDPVPDVLKAAKGLTFNASVKGDTRAKLLTGGGTILGAALNVAMAYGRTNSIVDVALSGGGEYAFVKSQNNGTDHTKSIIKNGSVDLITMSSLYGGAYSQDVYRTGIQLTGGNYTINGNVDVDLDYKVTSVADVEPAAGGVDVNLLNLAVNGAVANNSAYAGTDFETSIGTSIIKGDVNVKTHGAASTEATVQKAKVSISGAKVISNIAKSVLGMEQAAVLRVGGKLTVEGNVDVQSVVKKDNAYAKAQISPPGGSKDGFSIETLNIDYSDATARENMNSTAAILGAAYKTKEEWAMLDYGEFEDITAPELVYDEYNTVTYEFKAGDYTFTTTLDEDEDIAKEILLIKLHMAYCYDSNGNYSQANIKKKLRENFKDNAYADKVFEVIVAMGSYLGGGAMPNQYYKNPYTGEWELRIEKTNERGKEAMRKTMAKADDLGIFDPYEDAAHWTEIPNYETAMVTRSVWKERLVQQKVLMPVYDASKNELVTEKNLNIYTGLEDGGKTLSEAKIVTPYDVNMVTAGSMSANASSTDSFSVMLEGMKTTVTGDATLKAESDTNSVATGDKAGGVSGFDQGYIKVRAGVGQSSDYQTVNAVIGEGATLKAANIDIRTNNVGSATAGMKKDTTIAVLGINVSRQPTESWLSTNVSIGAGAVLEATNGSLNISSLDLPTAESKVISKEIGLLLNFTTMRGQNTITQVNNLDIGKGAQLTAKTNVNLYTDQMTHADAETEVKGGGFLSGSAAKSFNTIDRTARINVGDGAKITATNGMVNLEVYSGQAHFESWKQEGDDPEDEEVKERAKNYRDNIYTRSYVGSGGFVDVSKAKAYTDLISNSEILIGQDVKITAKDMLTMNAWFDSSRDPMTYGSRDGFEPGIFTEGVVDSSGLVPVPKASARTNLQINNYIGINEGGEKRTTIESTDAGVYIEATTRKTTIKTNSKANGKGGIGVANSTSWIILDAMNAVWIDNADISAPKWHIDIYARNMDENNNTHLIADSFSGLKALGGKVSPTTLVTGNTVNQIRSNDPENVKFTADSKMNVTHQANAPKADLWHELTANYKRAEIKVFGITISLTKANVTKKYEWIDVGRCDFCGTGTQVDIRPTQQLMSMEERYQEAYERALTPIDSVYYQATQLTTDTTARNAARLAKGLVPLQYMNTLVDVVKVRGRYGEEENRAAGEVFVLDLAVMLKKDARLDNERLGKYKLWNNSALYMDVYMLPNSDRLYGTEQDGKIRLQYVTEVMVDKGQNVEIITALTKNAIDNPEIPIGSAGKLNFKTGELMIPVDTDFEFYLNELSAEWLIKQFSEGFFRRLAADANEATDVAMNGGDLPEGGITEGLTEGRDANGRIIYWLGDTPETAQDPDQTLIYLTVDEKTDQVSAYRTTVNMLEKGEASVDVSLYVYRDADADRKETVKYDVMFFDTPEGEHSVIKILTGPVGDIDLAIPQALKVVLRKGTADGTTMPSYSLSGNRFVMLDGTKGSASTFGGEYRISFDGDVFNSDYLRISGIESGDLSVMVKKGQMIWPEWTDKDSAVDIQNKRYEYMEEENQWYVEDYAEKELSENGDAA